MNATIKNREREAILQSLRAGVVPRIGLQHIQVGRKDEVAAIINDLDSISGGAASIRFVIGRFGSGKSFFLNLSRIVALEKKFVVVQADISPEKRLHSNQGHARALYAELMQNMATRSKPNGGAISGVVERWVADIDQQIRANGGANSEVAQEIQIQLKPLQEQVSGYDFANVIVKYMEGFHNGNQELMDAALRWLRAEYRLKSEARDELGIRSIIEDRNIYDYLKLLASFVKMAGYAGLLVNIDEMGVFSHRLNNAQARNQNYEMVLRIVNDCLQGNVSGIGFIFAGTDAFLEDRRRGVYSYEALATRLSENTFAVSGLKDFSGPVVRLGNLSPEDLFVLLHNIRSVYLSDSKCKLDITDETLKEFMAHCSKTLGADYFKTPRDVVKAFVGFLSVLEQNPGLDCKALLAGTAIEKSTDDDPEIESPDQESENDDLSTFKL